MHELLDDREQRRAETEDVIATYRSGDTAGAWVKFLVNANITLPEGAVEAIVAAGRPAGLAHLNGPGVHRLAERLTVR